MRPGPAVLFSAVLLTGLTLSVSVWSQTTGRPAGYRSSRNAFGQPDLQGIWQALNAAEWGRWEGNALVVDVTRQSMDDGLSAPAQ